MNEEWMNWCNVLFLVPAKTRSITLSLSPRLLLLSFSRSHFSLSRTSIPILRIFLKGKVLPIVNHTFFNRSRFPNIAQNGAHQFSSMTSQQQVAQKRYGILTEIVNTERSYCQALESTIKVPFLFRKLILRVLKNHQRLGSKILNEDLHLPEYNHYI
jgi:hypothetical protein